MTQATPVPAELASPANRLLTAVLNLSRFHRGHEKYYSSSPSGIIVVAGLALVLLLLAACTADPNAAAGQGPEDAGFWLGLWQGFIAPITFVVSLFNDSVGIYEVHNNGGWYNFGFLIGVSSFFSGTAAGAGGRSRSARRAR